MAVETASRSRLGGLLALAERSERYRALLTRVEERGTATSVTEAGAGARAFAWSALVATAGRTVAVIAGSEDRARRWHAELAGWLGEEHVAFFPEREAMPYEASAPSAASVHLRLSTLHRLAAGEPLAVVAPLRALLQHTIGPDLLLASARTLRPGDRIRWDEVAEWLFAVGYEPAAEVSEPGTFSRRGGIIDIYPAAAEAPVRLELFGDEVETLRTFDPVTQRSQAALTEVTVLPAREVTLERAPALATALAKAGWVSLPESAELDPWRTLAIGLAEGSYPPGIESFAPSLGAASSLLDHLGPRATVVFEDTVELALTWDAHEAQADERRLELQAHGLPVGALPSAYLGRTALENRAALHGLIRAEPGPDALRLGWGAAPSYASRLDAFLGELSLEQGVTTPPQRGKEHSGAGSAPSPAGRSTVVIASPQAARLAELLAERGIAATSREDVAEEPTVGSLLLVHVPLALGFVVPELGLRVFTDAEVFGFKKPRHPDRRRRRVALGSFLQDLRPGDHIVHEESGIGRFERFSTREVAGVVREYLELVFADGNRSLPTEQIIKVTRYVGGTPPALSPLGGRDWQLTKKRAKKAVEEIAKELLALYAQRELVNGHQFGPDTPWQIEMENAFPFTETPDQLTAVEDVKKDMERQRPMDRLIVGDVGYGKTEVALRAAFKAVQEGKQVAVLVPTTVLAQQHFETFSERLATFPVRIAMLSRFRTAVEQRATIAALTSGEADIVVGTHRILQKDVRFRDLGLVVIDEEHRFGVKHKERMKHLRTEVDVLSLTATPIPRTLHMALSGVRDISHIETPPEDRQPIETRVLERSDDVLREAILREIDRGGQVYYVHNRVMGIEQEKRRIQQLVPRARTVIGHGQMDERALERVMVEFAGGEHDVLLCTTIIESGLDIPNVNTIVIDRAAHLGLAQLYQLRGRVGRSAAKAYAYLLYTKEEALTEQARKRLQAVFEASELGAGFKIAMHDLEIRGAGNLLGAEQHGHVTAIGFELYAQLLEQAVNEQRGVAPKQEVSEIVVDLALSTAIPDEYVGSRARKLETYRRVAGLSALDDLAAFRDELRERYGPPPESLRNLLYGIEVKIRAARAHATEVRARGPELRVTFGADLDPTRRAAVLRAFPKLQAGPRQLRLSVLSVRGDWRDALTRLLDTLAA